MTFSLNFLPGIEIINANGFTLTGIVLGYHIYEYTVTIPAYDPDDDERDYFCIEFRSNPEWCTGYYAPSQPIAWITTDCTNELYNFSAFSWAGPCLVSIDLNGGTQTISQIVLNNPTLTPGCNNTIGGFLLDGEIEIDVDWCFLGNAGAKIIMLEGSKISVQTGNSLLISNFHIQGCDDLWESIIVEPGAELEIDNSLVEDGYKSISIDYNNSSSQSSVLINKSKFNNNYISVFSAQGSNLVDSDVKFRILDSEFSGTGTLKAHSDPQATTYPALGLSIWNIEDVVIAGSAGSTMFSNMGTGIKASYCDIVMSGVYFKNMMNVPGPGAGQTGVDVFGVGSSLVNTLMSDSYFDGMHTGISNNLGTVDISSVTMKNLRTGIINFLGTVNDHRVNHNVIYASENGIYNVGAKPIYGEITNNQIYMDNIALLPTNTGGIRATQSYASSGRNSYQVTNNIINLNGTEAGIYLNASERYTVNDNKVAHDNMGSNAYGIRANAGVTHKIGCNEIWIAGGSVSNTAAGIQAEQTGNPIISCNVVRDYSFGTRFSQTSAMTDIKGNYLDNTNDDGLYIDGGTTIGQQWFKGNIFPSQGSSILFEARNFNSNLLDIQASQFRVNSSIDPEFLPNWYTPLGAFSQWFLDLTTGSNFVCSVEGEGEDCPVFDLRHEGMRGEMMAMALGENWLEGEEGITQKYVMQRQLLNDLEENETQGDEPVSEWLNALEDTDAFRMHSWAQQISNILNPTDEEMNQFEAFRASRASTMAEIQETLLACEEDPSACLEAVNALRQELSAISSPITAWQSTKSLEQQAQFENVLSNLPQVEGVAASLDLEASIYELQISINNDLSSLEDIRSRLQEISYMCPNVYGPGVYRSRGLLLGLGTDDSWDDEACYNTPEARPDVSTSQNSVVKEILIFPTLIKDNIYMRIPQGNDALSVSVNNMMGIQVYSAQLNEQTEWNIPVNNLPAGLYIIDVKDPTGTIKTQKVIKQ